MTTTLYQRCKAARIDRGLPWFDGEWDLNVLIARAPIIGGWNCLMLIACRDDMGRELVETSVGTSYASASEWPNPTHPDGCLYVRNGHYSGAWSPGLHRGRRAWRQSAPMDYSRYTGPVPTPSLLEGLPSFRDERGTHAHDRRNGETPAAPIPDDSEGCWVWLHRHQRDAALALGERQRQVYGVASVSPTFLPADEILPTR